MPDGFDKRRFMAQPPPRPVGLRKFRLTCFLCTLLCMVSLVRRVHAQAASSPDALQAAVALEQTVVDAIARCERSVVAVARVKKAAPQAEPLDIPLVRPMRGQPLDPTDPDFIPNEFGAGVVIGADGEILTNYHVIGDIEGSDHYVWTQHRPYKAKVVAADAWYDLAVLKIEASGLAEIPFGDARQLRKGQIVIALGNPDAIARDGQVSASWGIVSNLLRAAPRIPEGSSEPLGRETLHHYGTLIQTDAKLNVGFSGGALLNLRGEMIGLTTSYTAAAGYEQAAGFAIPVDDKFRAVVATLKQGRKPEYGFLGVAPATLEASLRQRGQHGAQISRVLTATPAARAHLQSGDVITHIDGQSVYDDDDLIRLIGSLPPESNPKLTIVRGNLQRNNTRVFQQEVHLTKKHVSARRPQYGTAPEPSWRGLQVDYATAVVNFEDIAHRIDPQGCVHVERVQRDSPAWNCGLRPGALISHVEGKQVGTPAEFYAAASALEGEVRLRVLTGPQTTATRTVSP